MFAPCPSRRRRQTILLMDRPAHNTVLITRQARPSPRTTRVDATVRTHWRRHETAANKRDPAGSGRRVWTYACSAYVANPGQ
jgi:hypothetical protein